MSRVVGVLLLFLSVFQPVWGAGTTHVGQISATALVKGYAKFATGYHGYTPTAGDVALLKQIKDDVELVVMFGTWCHDSMREVPQLIKLLEATENPHLKMELVGVTIDKQALPWTSTYQLRHTPTIVVLKGGVELGRIVERPVNSLATDLVRIIQG